MKVHGGAGIQHVATRTLWGGGFRITCTCELFVKMLMCWKDILATLGRTSW